MSPTFPFTVLVRIREQFRHECDGEIIIRDRITRIPLREALENLRRIGR